MSKIVEVLGRNDKGDWEREGTIKLVNGQLVADTPVAKSILADGIFWGDRRYSAEDGQEMLDLLPRAINGSYGKCEFADEDAGPSRHAREPAKKHRGRSSIPLLLDELVDLKAQEDRTRKAKPSGPRLQQ